MQKAGIHFRSIIPNSMTKDSKKSEKTKKLPILEFPKNTHFPYSPFISFTPQIRSMEAVRLDSQNLRDILRAKQDDAPLERFESNRTLLDIIRDEPGNGTAFKDGRRNWRHLKDKLRLRRNGSGSNWTSSVRIPASDIPLNNNTGRRSFTDSNSSRAMDRASGRFEHTSSLAMRRLQRERNEDNENEENEEDDDEEEGDGGGEPVRTSLMALLAEETERQMGLDGLLEDDDDDDDEDEEEDISGGGEGYNNCCVCMVRHKGAAFIPCGHTFCRLCSRELYAQRGNCPLCNNYILEILDIF